MARVPHLKAAVSVPFYLLCLLLFQYIYQHLPQLIHICRWHPVSLSFCPLSFYWQINAVSVIENCSWFIANRLMINDVKTEYWHPAPSTSRLFLPYIILGISENSLPYNRLRHWFLLLFPHNLITRIVRPKYWSTKLPLTGSSRCCS